MERPLSPFMFPAWYRFQITSALSILHRLTGIALAVGSILLAWWLVAVAAGGELFAATHAFIASPIGVVLLFLWSVAFFYHLCSGIRHLAWDAGYGVNAVEASLDGGRTWSAATLGPDLGRFAFRAFSHAVAVPTKGNYKVMTRATNNGDVGTFGGRRHGRLDPDRRGEYADRFGCPGAGGVVPRSGRP